MDSEKYNKILIVEDESLIAKQLQILLQKSGYSVIGITENGREAVRLARTVAPDGILMDVNISGEMDGIETALEIRKYVKTKILFISGYSDDFTKKRALETPFSAFITKPFTVKEFLDELKSLFENKAAQQI